MRAGLLIIGRAAVADVAAVLVDDAGGDGEAEAGPLPLGRVEGLEDVRAGVHRDAGAAVLDLDVDRPLPLARPDHQPRALVALHRLAAVDAEVEEDLLELRGIGEDGREPCAQIGDDGDRPVPVLLPDEEEDLLDGDVDVGGAQPRLGRAGEGEEALHRVGEPRHLMAHLAYDLGVARVTGQILGHQLQRAGEAGQRVLDLVREAGGDLADGGEPVGPHHPLAVEGLQLRLAAPEGGEHRVEAPGGVAKLVGTAAVGADAKVPLLGPAHRDDQPLERRDRLAPQEPHEDGEQDDERPSGREGERPSQPLLCVDDRLAREAQVEPAVGVGLGAVTPGARGEIGDRLEDGEDRVIAAWRWDHRRPGHLARRRPGALPDHRRIGGGGDDAGGPKQAHRDQVVPVADQRREEPGDLSRLTREHDVGDPACHHVGEELGPLLTAPVHVLRVDQDGARDHGCQRDGKEERGRDQDPGPHAGVEPPIYGGEEAQGSSCRGALSITAGRHSPRDCGRLLGGNGPPLSDFATQLPFCKEGEACDITPHVRLNVRFRTPKSFGFAAPA
jgi:hypothetical protein